MTRSSLPEVEAMLLQAQAALQAGRPADAALHLRRCGAQLLSQGLTEEAIRCLDRAIAAAPDAAGYYDRGTVSLRLGRIEAASADLDAAVELQPDWVPARVNRAIVRIRQNRPEAALEDYARAAACEPGNADIQAGMAGLLLTLNRLDAALAACDRALALASDDAAHLCCRGDILMKMERFGEALNAYDAAVAGKPGVVAYYNNRGQALRALGQTERALADFTQACILDRNNAVIHNNRGIVLLELHRYGEALCAFDAAISAKPDFVQAIANRGRALIPLDRPADAAADFSRALTADPENGELYCNRALAELALNDFAAAHADFDRAAGLIPDSADYQWNRAMLALAEGDYANGWRLYEARWRRPPLNAFAKRFVAPGWPGGASLAGKTLAVYAEQGVGDTIQFCRFVPLLQKLGAEVTLVAPDPLLPLLQTLAGDVALVSADGPVPPAEYSCPLMSLPHALGIGLGDLPVAVSYLQADEAKIARWGRRLGAASAPRIGLMWAGAPAHANDRNRSLPLAMLAPLLKLPAEFHSLQKDLRRTDAVAAQDPVLQLHGADLADFSDTAALIASMDLVVSVDTAVAHLAGALGKPVWILLPFAADWRWMIARNDSPWYPSARLFRQPAFGDWASVLADVEVRLRDVLAGRAVP